MLLLERIVAVLPVATTIECTTPPGLGTITLRSGWFESSVAPLAIVITWPGRTER